MKNILVYKLLLPLNISDFSYFLCKNYNPSPRKKSNPSKKWDPVKSPRRFWKKLANVNIPFEFTFSLVPVFSYSTSNSRNSCLKKKVSIADLYQKLDNIIVTAKLNIF